MLGRRPAGPRTRGPSRVAGLVRDPMTRLKLTLILVALLIALAIVAEARADVAAPLASTSAATTTVTGTSTSTTSTSSPNVPGPGSTEGSTPGDDSSSDPPPADSAPVPVAAGPPPLPTGQPPASTDPAPGSTSDSSPPDQVPSPSSSGDQPTTADGPSTDTSQVIVQVQVSGCVSYCQGTSQTQAADQQNVTVQSVPPAGPTDPPSGQATAVPQPQGSAHVTQIQVGCAQDCSDTGVDPGALPIDPGTLSQLLALLGSQGPADQPPVTPGGSSIGQTSLQTQSGAGSDGDQSQTASQWSGTVQELVSQAVNQTVQIVNQTAQTIVQVQIGCLFHCTDTHQTQQASQTSTAVQVVAQGVSAVTAPAATVVSTVVNQLVWQLQIGCLAWCSNTTQAQSAQQSNEVVVTPGPGASQDPLPAPPSAPGDPAPTPGEPGPPPGDPAPAPGAPAPNDPTPPPGDPGAVAPIVVRAPVVNPVHVSPVPPPSPPVVTPQPPPAVAVTPPTTSGVTAPSGGRAAPVAPEGGQRKGQAVSPVPIRSSSTSRHVAAAVIEPVARHANAATRGRGAWPTPRKISLGSWRIELSRPATSLVLGAGAVRTESGANGAVLAAVVALALGLVALTTIRIRTR